MDIESRFPNDIVTKDQAKLILTSEINIIDFTICAMSRGHIKVGQLVIQCIEMLKDKPDQLGNFIHAAMKYIEFRYIIADAVETKFIILIEANSPIDALYNLWNMLNVRDKEHLMVLPNIIAFNFDTRHMLEVLNEYFNDKNARLRKKLKSHEDIIRSIGEHVEDLSTMSHYSKS